jgi:hypothetical protein
MNSVFGNDEYFVDIAGRLLPYQYIGSYFPGMFYFCVIIIISVYLINAILDHIIALKLLSFFGFPLFLTIIASIALCITEINILQLWAIYYGCILICLHPTFKKLILHSESVGSYTNLKLIKGFYVTIKNIILKIRSTGIKKMNNPVDEIIILSASSLLLLLEVVVVISYIIYLTTYWRLIFLSYLIN